MRYAKRVDANQREIIKAFEALGCQVCIIGQPVDLIVLIAGRNVFVEIKDGAKPESARKHTKQQSAFFAEWRGDKATVSSVEQVALFVQMRMRSKIE